MHYTACHRFNVDSTVSKTRNGKRGNQSGWSGDHLDLPKAHGIPYMEVYSLQPCTLMENTVSKLSCNSADGNFQTYPLSKGKVREYYPVAWSTV